MRKRISRVLGNITEKGKAKHSKKLSLLAGKLPLSNGSQRFQPVPLKLLIVTDSFMYDYFEGSCEQLRYVSANEDFTEVLAEQNFDAFIFVSCWFGLSNDWYELNKNPESRARLKTLILACRSKGIPSIFYSIEDPSNYETFLPFAALCDYVFTSDADCIPRYQKDTGNKNVEWLEYGVNPQLNNPIGCMRSKIKGFFFAGSYPRRYANRTAEMDEIFESILTSGHRLTVLDRNFYKNISSYQFPKRFQRHVFPGIDHKLLQRCHKLFEWQLNFNSIQDSSTMCAMRVYELQAQGALILSNRSLSIPELFPRLPVYTGLSALEELGKMTDKEKLDLSLLSVRNVFRDKTVFDRLEEIIEKCELGAFEPSEVKLGVFCNDEWRDFNDPNDRKVKWGRIPLRLETVSSLSPEINADYVWKQSESLSLSMDSVLDALDAFKYSGSDFVVLSKHSSTTPGFEYVSEFAEHDSVIMTGDFSKKYSLDTTTGNKGRGIRIPTENF